MYLHVLVFMIEILRQGRRPQHNFRDIAIDICGYLRRILQSYTADISWDCTVFTASAGEKVVTYGNGKSSGL